MEQSEKRKEPRFPFYLPVQMQRERKGAQQQIVGTIKNVSMNGFRAFSQTWLAEGERIVCTFDVPETREKTRNEGIIKWCFNKDQHHFGVELLEKHSVALPLQRLTESFFRLKPTTPDWNEAQIPDLSSLQKRFYSEIFCGMLFRFFNKPLQSHLIGLSSELGLKIFYLNKIQTRISDLSLDKKESDHLYGLTNTLNRTSQALDRVVLLFQLLFKNPIRETHEEFPEVIKLDELLTERIKNFKDILDTAMLRSEKDIKAEPLEVPVIFGHRWSIAMSIDFLLLYTYQSILFYGATQIKIELDKKDNNIVIGFANDGSKIYEMEKINIRADATHIGENLKPKDRKKLTILRYVMDLYKPINTNLTLYNQSGNNLLLLKISL
ncbi:MAG: PilZ domain-containing protein [Desulfohalobiaceae bacterium]|nr:PilZ domain-containing protein [Desulfohalobiaceae bacterium]